MNISLLYNRFLGETSPLIAALIDSPVNAMGARRMENMIPMMTGGLRKRPGTLFIGNTDGNKAARLIEWLLSDGTCVMLEFTEGTIRVWRGNAVIQTLSSPYTAEQVKKLHYAASADVLWVVHPDKSPVNLTWKESDTTNENEIILKIFSEEDFTGKDFSAENDRPSCVAFESGRLCFAGSNNEPNRIYLSRAPDSQTGEKRYTDFTTEERYMIIKEISVKKTDEDGNEITEPVLDGYGNHVNETHSLQFTITTTTITYRGKKYNITETQGDRHFAAFNIFDVKNGDWVGKIQFRNNGADGYNLVHFYGDGIFANINAEYYCINDTGSIYNDWYISNQPMYRPVYETKEEVTENINVTPSHAIVLEENDMHGSRLQWIAGNRHLLAATERATWNDTGEVPTPATFDMNIIEYAGSNNLQGRGTKEIVVYAGRDGRSLRALVWNQNAQGSGYIDMDIGERAAHLLGAGIKDFAVADYPYPMIWIATNAGELISCTIDIRQGVLAYAHHPTEGNVESVAVSHETTGDVVYLVVKRGNNRNIECLILEDLVNADYSESHYVDAGERREYQTPTKTIDGLERFAGKTIHIFADGAIEPPVEVSNAGIAELQNNVSKVHFGLPYKAAFSPNERPLPANGTSMGKKQKIEKITLRLYKSLGGKAGVTEEKATPIITKRFGDYEMGEAPEPFTGEYDITVSGNIDTEGKLVITHEEPTPFTLLALVERVAILEV